MPAGLRHVLTRHRCFFIALAWLCLSPSTSAGAGARIQVTETDPSSPAILGSWHRFNVRISPIAFLYLVSLIGLRRYLPSRT